MTKRAYKERFYPTPEQAELLAQSFGCARFVWNNTLAYRTEVYQQCGETVSHSAAEKRLVALKAEHPWLKNVSSVILQQALRDQKAAFDNFFNPQLKARYLRFKRKDGRQSIRLTDLFITSEGMKSGNPRHLKRYEAKLVYLQCRLARKQKGSKNRAKAISDAGWGEFLRQLSYKSEWAGRQLVTVSQWLPSSKMCHGCGHKVEKLPLAQRHWNCEGCGQPIDRDINAARNIRTAGLAGLACGATGAGAAA